MVAYKCMNKIKPFKSKEELIMRMGSKSNEIRWRPEQDYTKLTSLDAGSA